MSRLLKSYGLNGVQLAPVIGCSHVTAKKKIDHPELLTLGDLYNINRKVGIPTEELKDAMAR